MKFADTGAQIFTVRAIYDEEGPTGGYAISLAAFDANVTNHVDNYVLVDTARATRATHARHAIETVLDDYPNADLRDPGRVQGDGRQRRSTRC